MLMQLDQPFGALPHQALDLAVPAQPRATVAYLHGGGFLKGSRKEQTLALLADKLGPSGMAVASVSYRLGGEMAGFDQPDRAALRRMMAATKRAGLLVSPRLYGPAFAAALFDVSAAVAALRAGKIAPVLAGKPVVLLGMSAGGIAALSLAYPPAVWSHRLCRPDAVLAVSSAMVQPWCLVPGGAPSVMLHGATDRIIPPQDAQLAQRKALACGADLRLIVTPIPGHVAQLTNLLHGADAEGRPWLTLLCDLVSRVR